MGDWRTLEGDPVDDLYEAIRVENKLANDSGGMLMAYIGCDGQNLGTRGTSFVQCVALHRYDDCATGKGGRVFYIRFIERRYTNRQKRLLREAELAINLALTLKPLLQESNIPFEVHFDVNSYVGDHGENLSNDVHDVVKGWGESLGLPCKTKPEAFVASIVADRHTRGVRPKGNKRYGKRKLG
jgi:predicted RNase H-related nuclease YkuK (DUF458 family)